MKVVTIRKSTGLVIDSQDNPTPGVLTANAIGYGIDPEDIEEREVTEEEFKSLQFPKTVLSTIQQLTATDAGMARVAEDIVDLLIAEGKTLPQSVMDKIAERKALRQQL